MCIRDRRNEEVIGIEVGAWRKEVVDGVTYCWVTTTEHKTGKGRVDYLVPELTLDALNLFAMCSTPLRRELEAELSDLSLIHICSTRARVDAEAGSPDRQFG